MVGAFGVSCGGSGAVAVASADSGLASGEAAAAVAGSVVAASVAVDASGAFSALLEGSPTAPTSDAGPGPGGSVTGRAPPPAQPARSTAAQAAPTSQRLEQHMPECYESSAAPSVPIEPGASVTRD